ncbi:MAG TPA: carboxypeptidase-like regulatory domain-containing protein [Planctomycetota bacterium]
MRNAPLLAALLAAGVLAALWWLWHDEPAVPVTPAPAAKEPRSEPATPAAAAPAAAAAAQPPAAVTRHEVGGDGTFVSESEEHGIVADAVRDGMRILVLGADRQPRANAKLDVRWRKGFGLYGNDRGLTDAHGRFATTVAEYEMLERVVLTDPVHGELESSFDFLPMANDPRTVLCIVPELHAVTVRVVDERGAAIPAATVEVSCGRVDAVQREFVLAPDDREFAADPEGRAVMHLPVGTHELEVTAPGYSATYSLRAAVAPGGRELTMHMLADANRHDVLVTVVAPPAFTGSITAGGFTDQALAPPVLEPDSAERIQLQFDARRLGPRTFVVSAPPMPWRCTARAEHHYGSADVEDFATSATVVLRAPRASKPMARLRCKLLLPGGEQTFGDVMVHTSPDLVYGPRHSVSTKSPFVAVAPGGRACVSAWRHGFPPALAGPIELTAGEHEVVLQFTRPMTIRGRVVDEHGNPAKAHVSLLRPAGVLRALGPDVPEILASSATGDLRGTTDDGAFVFDDVGAGEHVLSVSPEQTGWPAHVRVQPGDQDVVVRLGDGIGDRVRIEGRVTLSTTGAPVAGATVKWCSDVSTDENRTDADGRYRATAPPGLLHFTVMARRCAWIESEPAAFAPGLHTRDIVVSPSEPLFVRVRDEADRVPRLEVLAFDTKGREIPFLDHDGNYNDSIVHLDGNGRAELGGLPHAPLRLRLRTEDEQQSMDVDVPEAFRRDADFPIVWKPQGKPK